MGRILLVWLALLLLVTTAQCYFTAPKGAVVTLEAVTLFDKHNWFFSPSVYFLCDGENATDIPQVAGVMYHYVFSGKEKFQPLTTLEGIVCKKCGFYQHGWFEDSVFLKWELCPRDFTSKGFLTRVNKGAINVTMYCPDCDKNQRYSEHNSGGGAIQDDPNSVGVVIWVTVTMSALLLTVILAACAIYLTKRAQEADERPEEKRRFIELQREGEPLTGGGRERNDDLVDNDVESRRPGLSSTVRP